MKNVAGCRFVIYAASLVVTILIQEKRHGDWQIYLTLLATYKGNIKVWL